jgi:predicted RNA-binding protein with TRAM domain
LWCRHGFADKISGSTAQPGFMVMAYDAPAGTTPKVFMIQVNSAGAIVATPMAIGGGKP